MSQPISRGEKRFSNNGPKNSQSRVGKGEKRYTTPVPTLAVVPEWTNQPYPDSLSAHIQYYGGGNNYPINQSILQTEMSDLLAIYAANRL